MKKLFFLSTVLVFTLSCERTDCCVNPSIELAGKFSYTVLECDDSANLELSCTAWFEILNQTEARVLPFGDIAYYYNYVINGDILTGLKNSLSYAL